MRLKERNKKDTLSSSNDLSYNNEKRKKKL